MTRQRLWVISAASRLRASRIEVVLLDPEKGLLEVAEPYLELALELEEVALVVRVVTLRTWWRHCDWRRRK